MADEEELTRAEQVAKRAMELSARAEELARQAHEVSGVDEQLAALEAELDALAVEEAALDEGVAASDPSTSAEPGAGPDADRDPRVDHEFNFPEFAELAEAFGQRMEALGERIGDLVTNRLDSAFKFDSRAARGGSRWGSASGDVTVAVAAPLPIRVSTRGGRVSVRAGEASRILVHWSIGGPFAPSPDERPVVLTERDGVMYVESAGRSGMRGVSLDIEAPAGCPLDVSTGGGGVDVHGLGAAVRAKTGGGAVSIDSAVGEVVAETGGGSISYAGKPAGQSLLRTGGGSIDVRLAEGTSVELDARGSMASVNVDGHEVKGGRITTTVNGGVDGTLTVRTGGGSVRVRRI